MFKPKFYRRYVDDTFLIFDSEIQADQFHQYFNNKHPNIKFTIEKENNNTLSFLDITISKYNNQLTSSVFRKPTFTGLGTNYFSCTPMKYKLNSVRTLIHRAYILSSSYFNFDKETRFLRDFFSNNMYSLCKVDFIVGKYLDKLYKTKSVVPTVNKKYVYICFPYLDYLSHELEGELVSLVNRYYFHIKCNIVFKNPLTINSFFQTKERLCERLRSGIVYSYCCDGCNSSYVGSTAVQFVMRQCQHAGISHRTFNKLNRTDNSAIRNHCQNSYNCNFKFTNFKILDQYPSQDDKFHTNLRTLESMYIRDRKPNLNDTDSAAPIFI